MENGNSAVTNPFLHNNNLANFMWNKDGIKVENE
jgi:hypothetical protein